VVTPFLLPMALGAMLPTFDYDAIEYHLEGPKEYFQNGRITFLEHNVYTSMPFNVEMLHLLGMEILDDWWQGALVGQVLVACYAPATAAMIALSARRFASQRAAWVAAAVYLTTPWVYRIATIPYVEGPLCYFHAALIWVAARSWAEDTDAGLRSRLWTLAGLLAGGAMACKYTALVTAVVPFAAFSAVAAWRARSLRPALAFALGTAVVIGPWLLKNVVDTGNPVYPLAYRVFHGRHWDEAREVKWSAAHGRRPVTWPALVDGLLDVAGRSDWQSHLYVALAPLALMRHGSRRQALALWGYVLWLFAVWWLLMHRLDRFWLPILPAGAILAGLGADWTRLKGWSIMLAMVLAAGILCNFVYISTALAGPNDWTGDLDRLRSAVPDSLNPPLSHLDRDLPSGKRVLLVGQAAVFHMRHPVVYNTVFNTEILETLTRERTPEQAHDDLLRMGVDYVYVDWREIERFRSPGNYGFTAYITRSVFHRLVRAGVLEPEPKPGLEQDLYRVRKRSNASTSDNAGGTAR
jgi:hypothetical protein